MLRLPKALRQAQSPSHVRAATQEKTAAKRLGGDVTRGSGSGRVKADVRLKDLVRLECKTTKHKSFSVTSEIIEKVENAALGTNEIPVIEVELELGAQKVYVVPAWAMDLLLEALRGNGDEPAE